MMEDEERQRKLQAGKAKLAEYRQRKAQSDGQKKQKKKKKKQESEVEERVREEAGRNDGDQPEGEQNTVFSLSKTLRSGETVTHDQTYTVEPESEASTTAEDCSSEVNGFHERTERELSSCVIMEEDLQQTESHMEPDLQSGGPQSRIQIMEDELAAKNIAMEELSHELEEIRAAFGTEGVQQLQDFEEALKQRDEIITQLTANLQQARAEKEEVMREFLELTEQSQKLQIQFQQLQAGEILRSSNISSTAADLLQARQQIALYQQQLDEKDAQVKGHQDKTQERLLLISQLQEGLREAERMRTHAEESFAQTLQEKDLQNTEQQRLISEHLQSLSQLQGQLLNSSQQLEEVNKHLTVKTQELENCEKELSVSRQKERMSSGEILQLMKTVEDLQQRCHQGSQSEGETLQRLEEDWTRRMDQLRAELDEMYGQQIVQMKRELRVQHAAEVDQIKEEHSADVEKIVQQHRSELERFKGQLSQSTGGVNVLNVKLIELQNKLQESQVLREKAEQELTRMSAEKLNLVNQVERLHRELTYTRAEVEIRSKSPEKIQTEMQLLRDAISDLQTQLDAAQKANGDLEAKHESDITNYKIKLDMLEREKDAVLDRMAESQEAELERLRTQLLFSHEEELSRLREDLQRESQLNVENLRNEIAVRNREAVELLQTDFENKLRSVESERVVLATERVSLLQEIVVLKNDLNQVLESSRAEELVAQLKVLQAEVEDLRRRESERVRIKNDNWESESKDLECENPGRDELTSLKRDCEILHQKVEHLSIENEQKHEQLMDLQDEIEKQKNTFSFAEKNFEVNYQELKDEYTCLANAKVQLEERLIKETMEYEAKLRDLHAELQTRSPRDKTDDEEVDGKMQIEKDTTELMEKLEAAEKEKKNLAERLSETVVRVTLMEDKLKMVKRERDETVVRNKELESQRQTLNQPVEDCVVAGGSCSVETYDMHIKSLKEEIMMLQSSLLCAEQELRSYQESFIALTQENNTLKESLSSCGGMYGDPSPQMPAGEERETPRSTTASHTAAYEDPLTAPDSRRRHPQQVKTGNTPADGDAVRHDMMQLQDMDGSEHDECRLQMEAQRISLSQIHAAQLELLRESLFVQTQELLRSQEEELRDAHADELQHLQEELKREQQGVRGQHTELKESSVQQLKSEFQERSAHLEESHRREIEHLKIYYQQQMEEKQERFTAEILLLQQKLQELTGAEELFSVRSVCQSRARDEQPEHVQDEESLSVDAEAELVSAGLWRELQAVQEAPYESQHEEVTDLDVERVRDAQIRSHPEETHLSHLQEKHHQELLEQEIAKVIVQMSVEFAQQTEFTRISKQIRETSTAVQTDDTEDEMRREERLTDDWSDSVTVTTSQRCTQREEELQQMKDRETQSYPCMQNNSTQTEQKREEDEEVMKGRGHETTVTSQSPAQDPELSSDVITTERDLLRKANIRLRQVLIDVLKTTSAAEETIGRHVEGILESSKSPLRATLQKIPADSLKPNRLTAGPAGDASSESFHGSETGAGDISVFSVETDEVLETSQKIPGVELQLQEAELQLEMEEDLMSISTRLQSAVEKLLITITETTTQLEHAHITQTELMREKFRHNEEIEELLRRQEELQERLGEEGRAREQLALELHKAEGLIDGYTGERLALEQQICEHADLQLHFEQELHVTSSRLRELEQERLQIQQERELLSRQQDAMRDRAGSRELRLVEAALDAAPEADLLEETEKLMAEKVAVQRQAQKESGELQLQVRQLEAELEEQVSRLQELQELHRTEGADLRQQIQALEKQLENNRKFMDEQAADREHERDVFQQEIQNLEQQLRNPPKAHAASEQRDREVQELRVALQEKSDWCSELLLSSEQLQRNVQERDEEIDTLEARVTELQHTLMQRVEEVQHVSMAGRSDVTLEAQLQSEREALDRKEKEIVNLEEQLEQFREELENKSEEVNQLHMQLEIQRKEINSHQQELQVHTRLTQVLEEKDRQIAVLNEQIAKLQHTGTEPEKEVLDEKDEVLRELEAQVDYLRSEQERLKRNSEEEVDQLNAVIEKLQQELSHIEHKQPQEDETPGVREEYDEMKQKMDEVTRELDTLKADHSSLKSRYESLQEEAFAERDSETVAALEEALREKTAAFVVVQAQVQALEDSAGSRVKSLSQRVEELEICVEEKDSELRACRLKVEQAQTNAEALYRKVAELEENLRERVAAVLVSQAQLGAVQSQTKELHAEDVTSEVMGLSAQLESEDADSTPASGGKMSLLMEKLKELEEGLNGMQKDQEMQKQLLSSSEEEVQEYERRLAMLMERLEQMRTKPAQHRPLPSAEVSGVSSMSELLEELQEVKGEAASTKQELNSYRELSHKLQQEIEMKESTIAQLQTALGQVSAGSHEEGDAAAKLLQELQEVRGQMVSTQQELDSNKDQSATLQELLQEREMSIALLKDQLHRHASQEGPDQSTSELLQELQEVKGEAASTKEELNSYRERSLKLQEEIEVRDASITQLKEEVEALQGTLIKYSNEPLQQQPSSHPKKKGNRHGDKRENHGNNESGGTSKVPPLLSYRNSPDQSELSTSSLNVTSRTSHVDVGTQAELSRPEDMEEMIASYAEKIGQMQELHADEIMDMETRHITESESLKRENQQLEDECRALRDAINKLRTAEGPSARTSERPAVSPFKDGYASDSSSDWSQRTGHDLPHLQQEFRTRPEGAQRDIEPDVLPDSIKALLREVHQEGMQVLSLSELPLSEANAAGAQLPPQAWSEERDALINTVESLKSLIGKLQTNTDTQIPSGPAYDWRAELLSAVQQVFVQERDMLKNILYSHLERVDIADAVVHLNQLERALAEQDVRHRELMAGLCSADRNSLISEIHQLRAQLDTLVSDAPNTSHALHHVDNAAGMETEGERERSQVLVLEELKTELAQTKLELETTLKSQHKLLKELDTLRSEVSMKATEVDSLTERLSEEQKRLRELQWAFEKEKCRSDRMQETEREEVEDLKLSLEEQRGRVAELSSSLERERQISAQLREQVDRRQAQDISVSSELQVQLDAQRARADELGSALEKQKELNTQLMRQIQMSSKTAQNQQESETHQTFIQTEATCGQVEAGVLSVESLLQTLQSQLAEKQTQVVQMMEELERHKLDAVQRRRQFDEEKSALTRSVTQDQDALRVARNSLSDMERQTSELQSELNAERQNVQRLERERERLKERVRQLEERVRLSENNQSIHSDGQPADRTCDWVLQQKSGDTLTLDSSSPLLREVTGSGVTQSSDPKHMDKILGRLHLIAAKINNLTSDASGRSPVDAPDRESLAWLHSNVQDVMSLLQHIPSAPSALPESATLLVGGSSSLLNERLLRQNAELTGFVSRLTEEKNDLRNQLLKLEEELRRCRQNMNSSERVWSRSSAERQEIMLFSRERESWAQEKSRLEKTLRQTEAELNRLRGEIRSDTLREITGSDTDNSALKRLYGRYLRAESFRKALIYQKKYLLLLLGGFQECEEATLSLIARIGGHPTHTCLESVGHQRRGFTRFRSAVRVSIALSRMRFLVKRWQRASVGPITSPIVSRNGIGQITGSDVRNESSYLHPGSVEVFRERQATSCGRTGRDSPRSTASVQHRYHSVSGDAGAVLCSHLQNYDPDRALTDYISRLEALQRRLGSVQSGSSSYAQLHFGVRR
ncbi:A-kinase anchor protein 9 isoform X3 [Myxocyprinus asiaticus]|uniref:A-kinase anchor protein 9 isoform X3 n=1 Tax=Myxocyprinus asiaticus TaxID=70543 RepID=UPI0022217F2B|nr:A-kinase anchor protein 9 isoform X3 [Myxocyprinus asiaticus]